jgi:hypothetical protein
MSNPNKTVGNWRRKHPFPIREPKPTPFVDWLLAQAKAGVQYVTLAEAQDAYKHEFGT